MNTKNVTTSLLHQVDINLMQHFVLTVAAYKLMPEIRRSHTAIVENGCSSGFKYRIVDYLPEDVLLPN